MRRPLQNDEKIDIYMSERMKQELHQDATLFEAFFNKNKGIIMNSFLTDLVVGYYEPYKDERNKLLASIKAELSPFMEQKNAREISVVLVEKLDFRHKSYGDDSDNARVAFRPTHKSDWIISEIKGPNAPKVKLSTYLRQMFSSYLSLPMYERERIIFREKTDRLLEYCRDHIPIHFTTSAAEQGKVFHVIPYELVHGSDEMFNYLICQNYDEDTQQYQAATFRLCRMDWPSKDDSSAKLQSKVVNHLEMMKRCGPQYAINEDVISCIQLTADGQKSFAASYHGRPSPLKIETVDDDHYLYYFENSLRQLFFYFRRFSAKEAVIIAPQSLKEQIKAFHDTSWEAHNR